MATLVAKDQILHLHGKTDKVEALKDAAGL